MLKTKLTVFFSKKIVCFHFGNSKVTIKKFIKRVNKVREKGFDLQFFLEDYTNIDERGFNRLTRAFVLFNCHEKCV